MDKSHFFRLVVGVIFIIILSSFLDSIGIEDVQFYLGLGMGIGVGISQWLLLKKIIAINKKWIWFSALGMGIPFVSLDIMHGTISYKLAWSIALGSITVGCLQYKILKSYSQQTYLWIVSCFIGWSLAVATVFVIDYTKHLALHNLVLAFINLCLILGGGIVLGLITAIPLKKIINK